MSQVIMKTVYAIGHIGHGYINSVAETMGCKESDIVVVESANEVPLSEAKKAHEERFKISDIPLLEMPQAYDFEFERKKKKPKNAEWQNRMKQLMRR